MRTLPEEGRWVTSTEAWWRDRVTPYIQDMARRHADSVREEADGGFSLLELLVVLLIVGVTASLGVMGYRSYQENTAARRAAEVFVMDLSMARSAAVRERRAVAVVFDEANLIYRIRTHQGGADGDGRQIQVRDFSPRGEIRLGGVSLDLVGDSVVFNARGLADLSGGGGGLGTARFVAGNGRYEVAFNALGRARIEPF